MIHETGALTILSFYFILVFLCGLYWVRKEKSARLIRSQAYKPEQLAHGRELIVGEAYRDEGERLTSARVS